MDNLMIQILESINGDCEIENEKIKIFFECLTKNQQEKFKGSLAEIKKNKLYKGTIHGLYHSEKVFLNAYLLGIMKGLNGKDMQIIEDAAIYHDFKRMNDFEEPFHGYVSAQNIEQVIDHEIYQDPVNVLMLKAIIDFHCQASNKERINFDNYELPENEFGRYRLLAHILRDADALDRKRFSDQCQAALNPSFLKFEESKKMIDFATQINQLYYRLINQNENSENKLKESLHYEANHVFHSIGFDFFRIASILEHGILSEQEMLKLNLPFPRNFDGGNLSQWISVVPTMMIAQQEKAFKNFVQHGIVFLCDRCDLYNPCPLEQRSEAILNGVPYNKSGYLDEKYVFSKISRDQIVATFVAQEDAQKDVSGLSFLYHSLHFETLLKKINYLLNHMGYESANCFEQLIPLLAQYKHQTDLYVNTNPTERIDLVINIEDRLDPILKKINQVIQQLVHNYYANKLGLKSNEFISVQAVLNHEIEQSNQMEHIISGPEEVVFILKHSQNGLIPKSIT